MMFFFFFQAEDGIRDLVRSRGLGDVYKRQSQDVRDACEGQRLPEVREVMERQAGVHRVSGGAAVPVSYTHLTLPTSDLV